MDDEDRISELPEHILQNHILSLLPQDVAVRTCVLSKSWRHLGPTRPKIEFHRNSWKKNQEFLSVVEKTLRRYVDQNLSIQEFDLVMWPDFESQKTISLLEEWIPIVLKNKGLKTFSLWADGDFSLPLNIVSQSEFLEELFLKRCKLNNQMFNSWGKVQALKRLRTLSLNSVCIEKETFEKIMSICPLIQHLALISCTHGLSEHKEWFHLHKIYFFPRLKSLHLRGVQIPREWLNNPPWSNNNCLKTLPLASVRIEEETFEKIMSICPLIEHLVLYYCRGLRTIKVKMARNLKHLECHVLSGREENDGNIEIIDAPSLETISIYDCMNWYLNKNNYFFPRLKTLHLCNVRLPSESLNNLSSNNCPCLVELKLQRCSGFSEFNLSNRSIKRLIINTPHHPIEAVNIDVANILYFELVAIDYVPSIISFATTSREWKSRVDVWCRLSSSLGADAKTAWYLKLHKFLMALSQSQISVDASCFPLMNQDTFGGGSCEPFVVESLCLTLHCYSPKIPDLLNCAFRICRPRYIGMPYLEKQERSAEPVWKALIEKGETKFWQQDLEESSIQVLDENTREWHSVQECAFLPNNENIRFRLKWRE